MRKLGLYLAAAVLTVTSAAGAMAAGGHSGTANRYAALQAQIASLHAQAVASHNTQLAAALDRMSQAVSAYQAGDRKDCPPQSQGGRHGVTSRPCGKPSGALPICPSPSPNGGNPPPCGLGQGQGPGGGNGGGGGSSVCGPADQGGIAPTGPLSSAVYALGEQVSEAGGAPLGDAVQSVACGVNELTGL
jgi:hypothetical protein